MTQPTLLERRKGYLLSQRLGIPLSDLSVDGWMTLATDAEQTMQDVGPFDSVYPYFWQQREDALRAAEFVDRFPGVTPR